MASAIAAILLASLPGVARAQIDCSTFPGGPSKMDCYINTSRATDGLSDVAKARARSDARAERQAVGASLSKAQNVRRKRITPPPG
jgi:hypothetical protein